MRTQDRPLVELRVWRLSREIGLEVPPPLTIREFLAVHGSELTDALLREEPAVVEMFAQWVDRYGFRPSRPYFRQFRPIELGDAAIASGKSLRALQHASKKGTLKAWWVHGRWWTTLADVSNYLENYARNALRG